MHVFTSDYFMPDIHVHAPWCVSALSAFAVLARRGAVKSQTEDNYKTYLCYTASGRAIRLLVYLLRHTPSHWGSVTPHPPPPPHSCWLPAHPLLSRLTPLWMPVASSHGADDSHRPVSLHLVFLGSLPAHSVVTTEHNGITANGSLILFCFFMLLFSL